jgi:ribosomal protein L37E
MSIGPEYEYKIVRFRDGSVAIHCFQCGRISFHPQDVENAYCSWCDKFHDQTKELP